MDPELPAMLRFPSRCHCRNEDDKRSTTSEPSTRDAPRRYTLLPGPVRAQKRCSNTGRSSKPKAGTGSNLGLKARSKSPALACRTALANPRWAQLWQPHYMRPHPPQRKERGPQDSFLSPCSLCLPQLLACDSRRGYPKPRNEP